MPKPTEMASLSVAILIRASGLAIFLAAASAPADGWNAWSKIHISNPHTGNAGAQIATDGTNFYYAFLANGVWSAPFAPASQFTQMPMTGFPLWDANTNTNGFAVINIAATPQGTLVISGTPVNINNFSLNFAPAAALTNTLPVFYWWDVTNQFWQAATVTGKSYPYTVGVGNFSVAPDGSLWSCSGFASYAYRSTDGGMSYTAFDINATVPSNYFPMPMTGETSFGKIFKVAAGLNNEVVIGTETGGYLHTTNNGQSWSSLDPNFTDPNSANPLGRIGNAGVIGVDGRGNFLCDNFEMVADFPGLNTWSGVTPIGYHPADGSYYYTGNGLPPNLGEPPVVTTPSGVSFTYLNQNYLLQGGVFRSSDGQDWTQFNQGSSLTNSFPNGITNALEAGDCITTLGNLVFIGVGSSFFECDSTPPPSLSGVQIVGGTNLVITASAFASQPWVLQESTDLASWANVSTNISSPTGLLQLTNTIPAGAAQGFFRLMHSF
jgi:hypothetical protein